MVLPSECDPDFRCWWHTLFAFIIISRDDAIFRARTRNHSVASAAIFAQCYLLSALRVRAGAGAFEIITFIALPAWKIGFAAVENPVAPPRACQDAIWYHTPEVVKRLPFHSTQERIQTAGAILEWRTLWIKCSLDWKFITLRSITL
jgi:hypothetical protein